MTFNSRIRVLSNRNLTY